MPLHHTLKDITCMQFQIFIEELALLQNSTTLILTFTLIVEQCEALSPNFLPLNFQLSNIFLQPNTNCPIYIYVCIIFFPTQVPFSCSSGSPDRISRMNFLLHGVLRLSRCALTMNFLMVHVAAIVLLARSAFRIKKLTSWESVSM